MEDVQQLLRRRRYRDAFELLLDRYQDKVFRLAISMLRDEARAEDVTQDIFLKLWQALPAYDGRAAPSTWLYTIARNTCFSALRAQSYRETLPLEESVATPAPEAAPESFEVKVFVERLPEIQRQVIMLFYWEDRSVEEVAQALDLPEGTVKSHMHRARRTLAEMMKG